MRFFSFLLSLSCHSCSRYYRSFFGVTMPRLIRRQPLTERIKSYLNPLDFLLWLSEEIDANDWDQFEKDWALPLGVALNVVFLIARANTQPSGGRAIDDVFGEDGGTPWLSWFASFVVHLLACFTGLNSLYTFYRKRHYRMFEASIDRAPATPSAHRPRARFSLLAFPAYTTMTFLSSSFKQQAKDSTLVHKEVLKEYDTKYMSPNPAPNPNLTKWTLILQHSLSSGGSRPARTPTTLNTLTRMPQFRQTPTATGDGGSLGIYSHANSPLRKSSSTNFDRRLQSTGDFFYRERGGSPMKKPSSPLKRSNVPGDASAIASGSRRSHLDLRRQTGRF
ncbi:hypothetical protein AFLA_005758 [Aspergillus flavus NRRL3357]|nr:hypothetical protein AFLA_005758 [Aspergillus flavus NRRL3357]